MMIGITGGTGSGKTTALSVLEEYGAVVIDCDRVYYELLATSSELKNELMEAFPHAFDDGVLNRRALGETVFSDRESLDRLNGIIFKYVIARVHEIAGENELTAVDAISLIESGLSDDCDITVAVIAPIEERIRRIMLRDGVSRRYAAMRIRAQKPDEFYEENCDFVLVNDGDEVFFRKKCEMLFRELLGGQK